MKRLAVLLLLGCGSPKPTEQVVVPVASASAAPVVSAAPVASAPPPPSVAPPAEPVACPGECKGTSTKELEQALVARVKKSRRCYDMALAKDKSIKGKLTLELRIAEDGTTCSAKVGNNSLTRDPALPDQDVPGCMAGVFRDASFPKPKAGCVDVNIPVNLEPKP